MQQPIVSMSRPSSLFFLLSFCIRPMTTVQRSSSSSSSGSVVVTLYCGFVQKVSTQNSNHHYTNDHRVLFIFSNKSRPTLHQQLLTKVGQFYIPTTTNNSNPLVKFNVQNLYNKQQREERVLSLLAAVYTELSHHNYQKLQHVYQSMNASGTRAVALHKTFRYIYKTFLSQSIFPPR